MRGRPFWQHALALLLILGALIPVIGTTSAFVTDESFVVIQLDTIEATGGWTLPHPFPEVDPTGKAFPLHGASRFEDGYVLYGKHPLLIYLYLPVHRAFGIVGLVVLSVLGTWAAALVAARLAERVRAGSGVIALWLVGVGSPLFFDAFLVHAVTLAAALAGLAALLALQAVDDDRRVAGLGALGALMAVGLLRTEGIFYAAAAGGAIGLMGLLQRRIWLVVLGACGVATGASAVLIDRIWARVVVGSPSVPQGTYAEAGISFLAARRSSASATLLESGYRGGTLAEGLTLLGAVLLVVGTVVVRRRPTDEGAVILPVAGAAVLVVRAGMEWGAVPGLLVAFCVGVAGLALLDRALLRALPTRFLLLIAVVFMLAVAATQYAAGGHTEWGGRYFALALPVLGALAAGAVHRALPALPARTRRALGASLVAATLALGTLAVITLHQTHARNRERVDGVLAAAAALPHHGGKPPVVVTEDEQVPRLTRGRYGEVRFLRVPPREVARYLERLADQGVEDLLLVAVDPTGSVEHLPDEYQPVGPITPHELQWEGTGGLIHLHLVGS